MTTKPRPKHLTLRTAEVARFLRPSGLVVLPCKYEIPADADEVFFWQIPDEYAAAPHAESGAYVRRNSKDDDDTSGYIRYLGPCPLGGPGTEWVGREAWEVVAAFRDHMRPVSYEAHCVYRTDASKAKATTHDAPIRQVPISREVYESLDSIRNTNSRWRPARSMPIWAARIRKTTERVELRRVRTITQDEAMQTGVGGMRDMRFAAALGNLHSTGHRLNFMDEFNARYPGAWDRDDFAWFVFYTDTLGKD